MKSGRGPVSCWAGAPFAVGASSAATSSSLSVTEMGVPGRGAGGGSISCTSSSSSSSSGSSERRDWYSVSFLAGVGASTWSVGPSRGVGGSSPKSKSGVCLRCGGMRGLGAPNMLVSSSNVGTSSRSLPLPTSCSGDASGDSTIRRRLFPRFGGEPPGVPDTRFGVADVCRWLLLGCDASSNSESKLRVRESAGAGDSAVWVGARRCGVVVGGGISSTLFERLRRLRARGSSTLLLLSRGLEGPATGSASGERTLFGIGWEGALAPSASCFALSFFWM